MGHISNPWHVKQISWDEMWWTLMNEVNSFSCKKNGKSAAAWQDNLGFLISFLQCLVIYTVMFNMIWHIETMGTQFIHMLMKTIHIVYIYSQISLMNMAIPYIYFIGRKMVKMIQITLFSLCNLVSQSPLNALKQWKFEIYIKPQAWVHRPQVES